MFAAVHARQFAWEPSLQLHADLIECIEHKDAEAARLSMRRHLENFKERAEQILQ
jgi:DNA-binding FadR family transcriptional regulator